jgi:hypothetical protein
MKNKRSIAQFARPLGTPRLKFISPRGLRGKVRPDFEKAEKNQRTTNARQDIE